MSGQTPVEAGRAGGADPLVAPPTQRVPLAGDGERGPGERLSERLGPYRLVQQIGEGGMGVVHLALDPHGRAVAIKVLRAHVAHDADARARLEREVDTLTRVDHPRVAPVVDADLHGPRPYVVTRYIAGDPLDELVAARGPLSGAPLVRLARGLYGALEAIHAVGVVHRDLKPGNVLLDDAGEPVVIDFGIAHVAEDIRLTSTGLVMGTPGYLAPEVIEGEPVTEATDWWGWAATLVFAATGRPPFGRGRMEAVLARVRAGECDLAGVDPRLEPLLCAALDPRPAHRPPAATVLAALERYAAGGLAADLLPPVEGPPAVGTEVLSARHTRVMPVAESQPVAPTAWPPPDRWPPPAVTPDPPWGPVGPGREALHDGEADGGQGDQARAPGAWAGDPRIGRPDRTGTLLTLALGGCVLAAVAPVVAVLVTVAWSWLARTVDRSTTALVLRRFERGRRRSDVPVAVAMGPVHLVGGAVATLIALVVPALVALAGVLCAALAVSALTSSAPDPAHPVALALGLAAGLLTAWWGPGGASLRRGSKSTVRGLVPAGLASDIVVGLLLALAGAGIVWLVVRGGAPVWWPRSGPPGLLLVWR